MLRKNYLNILISIFVFSKIADQADMKVDSMDKLIKTSSFRPK